LWTRVRGHHDSFCDRTQRLTYRPTGWPGSSLALKSCSVAGPHPYHTRPGMVSQSNDGDPHGKPPRRYRAGTVSALPRVRGNRFAKRAASAAMRTGTWSRSATSAVRLRSNAEPPWQQNRQIGIPRACTDQARCRAGLRGHRPHGPGPHCDRRPGRDHRHRGPRARLRRLESWHRHQYGQPSRSGRGRAGARSCSRPSRRSGRLRTSWNATPIATSTGKPATDRRPVQEWVAM